MPDNIMLTIHFRPVGGEEISVMTEDFRGEHDALRVISHAIDERLCLVLTHARHDREDAENGMVINLANMVSVRVSTSGSAAAGQYL